MAQPFWYRGLATALVFSLTSVAACGDDGDDKPEEYACDDDRSDCDKDGLTRGFELANGLNPDHPDTDGDGFTDDVATPAGSAMPYIALQEIGDGPTGEHDDADGDGIPNLAEAWNASFSTKNGALTRLWNAGVANSGFQCTAGQGEKIFPDSTTFRFDSLQLREPGQLGAMLSGIMGPDINSGRLNVLAPVGQFDTDNCVGVFELAAGGGVFLEEEGHYIWEQSEAIQQDINSVRAVVVQTGPNQAFFRTIEPLTVIFPGFLPGSDPENPGRFSLPLKRINAVGYLQMAEDGAITLNAMIDGVITFEDAEKEEIRLLPDSPLITIYNLLNADKPYYWAPGETEPSGFRLLGTFTAYEVDFVDAQ